MVVVLTPLLVPVLILLLALLMWAMRRGLFQLLQSAVDSISTGIFGLNQIARAIRAGFNAVLHFFEREVARVALKVEAPLVGFGLYLAHLIEYAAFTVYYIPAHLHHALRALRNAIIPALLRVAVHPLRVGLARAVAIEHEIARELHLDYARLRRYAKAAGVAAVAVVELPLHGVEREARSIRRWLGRTWAQIRALRRQLTVAGLAGIVLAVLARAGYGWLRCRNVKNVGRRLCRFPVRALEELLADTVAVLAVSDLCRMVKLMTAGARAAEPAFEALVAGIDGLIACTNSERPGLLPVTFYAPPAAARSLLLD